MLPQGGEVVAGAAQLDYSGQNSLIVNQSTATSIIDWTSFDIAADHSVYFNQPDASSATLNRVNGDTPSTLAGSLSAPGMVMLVNPNGIAITQGAIVDTGSFVASTLDIADADFLSGRYTFRNTGRSGVVTNRGTIRARTGGSVALIGSGVVNEGVVEAHMGRVAFGAGDLVTLDFAGDGFLSVGLPVSELSGLTDAAGNPLSALITADGVVRADGGRIYISAAGAADLMLRTVNVPGDLIAHSISRDSQGRIVLDASNGVATITGNLDVSGDAANDGGGINIQAGSVAVGGVLNADGAQGGTINVQAAGDLLLAGSVVARGLTSEGGAITYSVGGGVLENTSSTSDVSGATNGGLIALGATNFLSSGRYLARGGSGAGGRIDISGGDLTLLSTHLDASGGSSGGLVRVGGGFEGGNAERFDSALYSVFEGRFGAVPGLTIANSAFLNDGVTIDVSSSAGAGGTAIVWSQTQTTMLGSVNASGATGGAVEVSSAGTLRAVDLSTLGVGAGGQILLDPANIVIGDFAAAQSWSYTAIVGAGVGGAPNIDVGGLESGDDFGISVALNAAGDRMAVGSFLDDGFGNGQADSGAVRLFSFTNGNFGGGALVGTIGAGYVGAGNLDVAIGNSDLFGVSVSLDAAGDRLAVGARRDDGAGDVADNTGAAYLFTFTDTSFGGAALAARVGYGYDVDLSSHLDDNDLLGHAVSLNAAGDLLAIGAYQDDGAGNAFTDSGAVYLISFADTSFHGGAYVGTIGRGYSGGANYDLGSALAAGDWFGYALSFNAAGDRLAVGAIQDDGFGNAVTDSGSVRLISFSNTHFAGASLISTAGAGYASGSDVNVSLGTGDLFGAAVSLNAAGDLLAVGAPQDDGFGDVSADSGAIRLIHFADTSFGGGAVVTTIGRGYAGAGDLNLGTLPSGALLGRSVSLNAAGNRLASGTIGDGAGGTLRLFSASPTTVGGLLFSDDPAATVNLSRTALAATLSTGVNVTLQASNDITLNAGGGIIVNNAGGDGGDLTLQAGRSVLLNAAIVTDNGDLTVTANETLAAGVVNAHRSAGGGAITAASINAGTGAVRLTVNTGAGVTNAQGGDITLASVDAGSVVVENLATAGGGDIVLNGVIHAESGATPIVIAAGQGDLINAYGAGALNTGAGRFIVYAAAPGNITANGLTASPYYNTAYNPLAPTALSATGNRFAYVLAPTLTVTAGDGTRVYGDADPATTYLISGLLSGDTLAAAVQGAPNIVIDAPLDANVGTYDILATLGTLASDYNYGFTFAAGAFQITPRAITVTADDISRIYGDADPALTYAITSGNLVFSDSLSGSLTRAAGENVGFYTISQGALTAGGNYTLTFVDGAFQITPRAITVTTDDITRIYGDADPALTYSVTSGNLAFSDTLSGALARDAGENVGLYNITQGALTAGSNYTLTFVNGSFQITLRAITVTADDITRIYGDADPALTYAITSGNLVFSDVLSGSLTRAAGENVGLYTISQGGLTAGANYTLTFVDGAFQITPRAITVTADDISRIYGDADPALTYAITSGNLAFSDTLSGALTRTAGESVGVYDITQGALTAGSNYTLTFVNGAFQITPRAITVTADDISRIYGDADPALTYAVTSGNLVFGDALSGLLTRTAGENVGLYAISQGGLTAGSNYTLTFANGGFQITPRAITVTADDITRIYGDADPALTFGVTSGNLVFGDVLSGSLTRGAGENVGIYAINQGGLTGGSNYTLTFVNGAFHITPRAITVTADDISRIYGDADPALTYAITSGNLVFGDLLSGSLTRAAGDNVGMYAISQGGLTAGSNYTLTFVDGAFQITPRAVTVTADDFSRIYGDADPALTYAITSGNLVFGDALSGSLTRAAGESVGIYAIGQGALTAGSNYTLTFVNGAFQITPRAITVTADDITRIYGDADPALTYALTSGNLVFGDTLSGMLTRSAGENVGVYTIGQGALTAGANYTLTFINGAFQITPRAITVTADDITRTYGDADPALSYSLTAGNLVFGDTLSGSLARGAGENVGIYAISQGALTGGANYTLTFVNGSFQITPRAITVTADDITRIYGDADPALTYAVTSGNLAFSDSLSGSLTRAAGENVGFYGISQGGLTAGSNYTLTFVGGAFQITPRAITVTADNITRIYGDADPALTYALTSGNLVFGDTLSGALARTAGENVGIYTIGQGGLTAGGNYTLTFVNGAFHITPRAITVTANDITRIYGDADPALTYNVTSGNLVFGDLLSGSLARAPGQNVGVYTIGQGGLTAGSNYTLTFVNGAFHITPRAITVTGADLTRLYGNADPALTYSITSGNLVFGDTLSGALTRTAGENVGVYAITQGGLAASANYTLIYVNGGLHITPRSITVTADNASILFGDPDPLFTYAVTGGSLVFGDLLSGSLTRQPGGAPGDYAILRGSLGNANYVITFINGVLTILPLANSPAFAVGDSPLSVGAIEKIEPPMGTLPADTFFSTLDSALSGAAPPQNAPGCPQSADGVCVGAGQ